MQIQVEKTLDVEVVERHLAALWTDSARDPNADTEAAVLRARVANLLVFISSQAALDEAHQMLRELTAIHPSRVLLMLGAREGTDRDIEMFVESISQMDKRGGAIRLSCEEITLKATGKFVTELPSAALPLLVPDLSTFLWWQAAPNVSDKVLDTLLRATDRLVIDSADFADPYSDLTETNKLFSGQSYDHVGISDLNWARLTFWRGLLADFYDVPTYFPFLNNIDHVRVDYVGPELASHTLAPQALLIAGWLASRLEWNLSVEQQIDEIDQTIAFNFQSKDSRTVKLKLNRVAPGEHQAGRLVRVELRAGGDESGEIAARPASFTVSRSEDNLHLVTEAKLGPTTHRGRVLPVRNRSTAQLLSREMEILCNDQIYQEAVAIAARMLNLLSY
jgi:glucose-6-phosphate dehydrogenase assembly protein OpcA